MQVGGVLQYRVGRFVGADTAVLNCSQLQAEGQERASLPEHERRVGGLLNTPFALVRTLERDAERVFCAALSARSCGGSTVSGSAAACASERAIASSAGSCHGASSAAGLTSRDQRRNNRVAICAAGYCVIDVVGERRVSEHLFVLARLTSSMIARTHSSGSRSVSDCSPQPAGRGLGEHEDLGVSRAQHACGIFARAARRPSRGPAR